jgi:hypothetical protein
MLKKYYTCEVISKGQVVGSRVCYVFIWQSAMSAYEIMDKSMSADRVAVNLRRIS